MYRIIKAPAKINLTLDVLNKRDDGYHEVEMIMTTVDLADRIHLRLLKEEGIFVEVNIGHVPSNHHNLAFQAAEILKKRFSITEGVHIYIDKQIPVSAGLAGGSADAAAVLRGLNQMWSLGLSLDELAEIGLMIGSDVPYCVHGGTAFARGRGEKLTFIPSPPPFWVVLAKPPMGISTKEIYQRIDPNKIKHPDTYGMIEAIENQNYQGIYSRLSNVMEEATFEMVPQVGRIKQSLIQFGAEGTVMSGSGPTIFSLTRNKKKADRLYNGLKGFMDQVFVVRLLGQKLE